MPPVDVIGALYWNPVAIGRLGRSEVALGGAFTFPIFYLDTAAPGLFGQRTGRTRSDSGVGVTSNLGVVYQPEEGPLTFDLGMNTQAIERASLSLGYVYNDNPIPSVGTLFNVQSPLITQHMVTVGSTGYARDLRLCAG